MWQSSFHTCRGDANIINCVYFAFLVAPIIDEIVEREYNTSDSVVCNAEGVPAPMVSWSWVAGSMPQSAATRGQRQAVLTNLRNGQHIWTCTASNRLNTTSVTVEFTGAFYWQRLQLYRLLTYSWRWLKLHCIINQSINQFLKWPKWHSHCKDHWLGDVSKLHQDMIVGISNVLTVDEKLTVNLQRRRQ